MSATGPIARAIASAVLYEGYLLYPYQASAVKNRKRWTLGTLAPRDDARPGGEPCRLVLECLVEAPPGAPREKEAPRVSVSARFLQVVDRAVEHEGEPVARLEVDGRVLEPWQEGDEREVRAPTWALDADPYVERFGWPSERHEESVGPARVVRRRSTVEGELALSARPLGPGLTVLRVELSNLSPAGAPEDAALRGFAGAHLLLEVSDGAFVSAIDPPPALRSAAETCAREGCWPVLLGRPPARDTLLGAPIILYDYPRVAPESPGELFDHTEIDAMLALRIRTLTDAEKRDMAALDPRAAAALERAEALDREDLERLHGRWQRRGDAPHAPGDRVRVHPRPAREGRRADGFDLALEGRAATVVAVEVDFEGGVWCAIVVDDDPGRDLGTAGMPGHRFFYRPDELEPLP